MNFGGFSGVHRTKLPVKNAMMDFRKSKVFLCKYYTFAGSPEVRVKQKIQNLPELLLRGGVRTVPCSEEAFGTGFGSILGGKMSSGGYRK